MTPGRAHARLGFGFPSAAAFGGGLVIICLLGWEMGVFDPAHSEF